MHRPVLLLAAQAVGLQLRPAPSVLLSSKKLKGTCSFLVNIDSYVLLKLRHVKPHYFVLLGAESDFCGYHPIPLSFKDPHLSRRLPHLEFGLLGWYRVGPLR